MPAENEKRWTIALRRSIEPWTYHDGRPGLVADLIIECPNCATTGAYIVHGTPDSSTLDAMRPAPCPVCGGDYGPPLNPFAPDL